jgi:hypothetical protein
VVNDLIRFACPGCGKPIKARADHAGRTARCPNRACAKPVRIPAPRASEPDPDPAPRRAAFWLGGLAVGLAVVVGLGLATGIGVWFLAGDGRRAEPPNTDADRVAAAGPQGQPAAVTPAPPAAGTGARGEPAPDPPGPPPAKPEPAAGGTGPAGLPAVAAGGPEVRRFEAPEGSRAVFTADGKRVVSVSYQLELVEWEVGTGKQVRHQPAREKHSLLAIAADLGHALIVHRPDPKALGWLHLWDLGAGRSVRSWPEPDGDWETYNPWADFSPDASTAVVLYVEPSVRKLPGGGLAFGGDRKKQVFQLDAAADRPARPLPVRADSRVAYSPDGKYLVTDQENDDVVLWDAKTGRQVRALTGTPGSPARLVVSPDGKYVAAACIKGDAYPAVVWDAHTGEVVRKLEGHRSYVRGPVFRPDGRTVLVAECGEPEKGFPPAFHLWDFVAGRKLGSFEGQKGVDVFSVALSPDGGSVVSAGNLSGKGVVQVWQLPR